MSTLPHRARERHGQRPRAGRQPHGSPVRLACPLAGRRAHDGGHTIHVGSDDHYIALHTGRGVAYSADDFAKGRPLNHIGVRSTISTPIEAKVAAAGLKPFGHDDYDPGRRFYFLDPDGIEYEVVSYR